MSKKTEKYLSDTYKSGVEVSCCFSNLAQIESQKTVESLQSRVCSLEIKVKIPYYKKSVKR